MKSKLVILALVFISGCGTPKKELGVTLANPETIEVYYKNNCASCYEDAVKVASAHCGKFNKNPIPLRKSYIPGRTVTTFLCR